MDRKVIAFIVLLSGAFLYANLQAQSICEAINEHLLATFGFDPELTEIECRPEIDTITVSDSTRIIVSCREYPAPRGYFPLKVLLQEGSGTIRTLGTAVEVRLFANVLTAKNRVKSGDPLVAADFTLARVEIGKLIGNPIGDFADLAGMQASKTISSGKVITEEMLELIPVVKRGERVKIVYQSGSLRVEAYGIARTDAVEGEIVEVKNTASGQRIMGRAMPEGIVRVEK